MTKRVNITTDAGADVVTLGNHAWDQREALVFIERSPRMIPSTQPACSSAPSTLASVTRPSLPTVMSTLNLPGAEEPGG